MIFTSVPFFIFLLFVLSGLCVWRRKTQKIYWLIGAGAFFYGYWNWKFLLLISFTSVFDFWMGRLINQAHGTTRKWRLALDVGVNLGILCIFKYANFFIESANALLSPLGIYSGTLHIILPLGISFYVFEAMSYCIDIYRGNIEPYRDWRDFALFIFFFPRMIAGPIIRPSDFLPQLQRDIQILPTNFWAGAQMFLVGMTKKVVLADNLAPFVDLVFAHPNRFSGVSILQATVAYSIQIFCDFSGYSDMAIGLAKIIGFNLPTNFRMPYLAVNLTDFWRRWHISLSSWLRDYLYISLGGNRHGLFRTYFNLIVTMLIGGLWHGASWNFVLWGFLHGCGLIIHRLFSGIQYPWKWEGTDYISKVVSWILTSVFVCLCWVFFRVQDFNTAWLCIKKMAGVTHGGVSWLCGPLIVIAFFVAFAHAIGIWIVGGQAKTFITPTRFSNTMLLFMWVLGIFLLSSRNPAPFIYFQF